MLWVILGPFIGWGIAAVLWHLVAGVVGFFRRIFRPYT